MLVHFMHSLKGAPMKSLRPHYFCIHFAVKCQSASFIAVRNYPYTHYAFSILQATFNESTCYMIYSVFQFTNTDSETLQEYKLLLNL